MALPAKKRLTPIPQGADDEDTAVDKSRDERGGRASKPLSSTKSSPVSENCINLQKG